MEFLHVSLALSLGVCQPVPVLKQFRGDFVTFVIALRRDYLAVIPDAVIDQMAVRIVRVMVSYQDELGVPYAHQFHVFKKMAEARKTTMGHITQDHLQQSTIAIPDNKDIADKFEELISPIFKQIVKLQEEISNFIKQRDELLPLLMNGQITIE